MKSYEHLSYQENYLIYSGLCNGDSQRSIARTIGRNPSTVSRVINRCSDHIGYHPQLFVQSKLRSKQKIPKIEKIKELESFIISKLKEGWSPGIIAGRWKLENPLIKISTESIYQWIYNEKNRKNELYKLLPRAKKKRGLKRYRRSNQTIAKTSIHERPDMINKRIEFGHCEADLFFNRSSKSENVTTLIERKSRYIKLIKNNSKQSDLVIGNLKGNKPNFVKSITFDNGSEFAKHDQLKQKGISTFFCDPGCPWQKGSVENCNRLLRSYLPYKMESYLITQEMLDQIAYSLNHKPRKILGFLSPCEFLSRELQGENQGCCT